MFGKFNTKFDNVNDETQNKFASKRKHQRREKDRCIGFVNDMPAPVENWSMGGTLLNLDGKRFKVGQEHDVTLRFKMHSEMVDVPSRAVVVRKSNNNVAFQFKDMPKETSRVLTTIVGEMAAAEFAESQQ